MVYLKVCKVLEYDAKRPDAAGTTHVMLSKCVTRREEMAARARRRREANRERKNRLEWRRLKEAEATRVKHEGPSLAEVVRANVCEAHPAKNNIAAIPLGKHLVRFGPRSWAPTTT